MAMCREQLKKLRMERAADDGKTESEVEHANTHITLDLSGINLRRLGIKSKNGTSLSRDYLSDFFGLLRATVFELQRSPMIASFGLEYVDM